MKIFLIKSLLNITDNAYIISVWLLLATTFAVFSLDMSFWVLVLLSITILPFAVGKFIIEYGGATRNSNLVRHLVYALIIFVTATILASEAQAKQLSNTIYDATLIKIVDGDTVHLSVNIWIDQVVLVRLRLVGINTPEISRAKSQCEKILGWKAKKYLEQLLLNNKLTITQVKYGTWAGRHVGKLYANSVDVGELLVKSGHAVVHIGRRKSKKVWCQ